MSGGLAELRVRAGVGALRRRHGGAASTMLTLTAATIEWVRYGREESAWLASFMAAEMRSAAAAATPSGWDDERAAEDERRSNEVVVAPGICEIFRNLWGVVDLDVARTCAHGVGSADVRAAAVPVQPGSSGLG